MTAKDPDWLASPETAKLRADVVRLQKNALDRLISAASVSADANVRSEHAKYAFATGILAEVSPGGGK